MPVLKVNATRGAPQLHESGDLDATLTGLLGDLPPGVPVVVLVHGYKFAPTAAGACPQTAAPAANRGKTAVFSPYSDDRMQPMTAMLPTVPARNDLCSNENRD